MRDVETYFDENGVEVCDGCGNAMDGGCVCDCDVCGDRIDECACEGDES